MENKKLIILDEFKELNETSSNIKFKLTFEHDGFLYKGYITEVEELTDKNNILSERE